MEGDGVLEDGRSKEDQEFVDSLKALVPDVVDVLISTGIAVVHGGKGNLDAAMNARDRAVANASDLIDKIVAFHEK